MEKGNRQCSATSDVQERDFNQSIKSSSISVTDDYPIDLVGCNFLFSFFWGKNDVEYECKVNV